MAKLGEQLKGKIQDQRATRTQRVQQRQVQEKAQRDYETEKARFEDLKAKAKVIQDTKFKDRVDVVDEQYNNYRPQRISAKSWDRMSAKRKASELKQFQRGRGIGYYASKGYVVVHSTGIRQVEKVVPFTLEDIGEGDNSYKDVYEGLSPDLKQFFDTPDVVLEQKAIRIKTTKQTVQDKLASTDVNIAELKAKYEAKVQKKQDWWSSKSSSYRNKENNDGERYRRQDYKDKLNDYEDDYDEDLAKLRGYKKGLVKGSQQLDQNKDVDFKSIEDYAWDVGRYEEDREEARNENRNTFYEQARSGKLDETFEKLGLDKNKPSYYGFDKKVDAFNKEAKYKNTLIKWADKVGFDKISPQAQKVLNPSIVKFQKNNPDEKLIFKGIDVVGVESGSLQQSISIGNYQKVTSPEYIKEQWRKKNPPRTPAPTVTFDASGNLMSMATVDPFTPKTKDPNAIYIKPQKTLTAGKELPFGYGGQQTVQMDGPRNIIPYKQVMDYDKYLEIKNTPSNLIKDIWGGAVKGFNWAKERTHFGFQKGIGIEFGKIEKKDAPDLSFYDENDFKNSFENKEILTAGKELPYGYGGQQTIQMDGSGNILPATVVYTKTKDDYDPRTYREKYGKTKFEGGIDDYGSFAKENIGKLINWGIIGNEKLKASDEKLEDKYQGIYKYEFEQEYFEKIVDGEIDFETASKEFDESDKAKQISKQYATEYETTYKDLKKGKFVDFDEKWTRTPKIVLATVGATALGLTSLGSKAIRDPLSAGLTIGAVYTGTKAFSVVKAIPYASTTINVGLLAWGGSTFLNKDKGLDQRTIGLITGTIAGVGLAKSGYSYLKRADKVRVVHDKAPIRDLKSANRGTVGTDWDVKYKGQKGNVVSWETQKLSQQGVYGTRTIWSSKGRNLFNKYLSPLNKKVVIQKVGSGTGLKAVYKFSMKPSTTYLKDLYQGVPTAQLGKTYSFSSPFALKSPQSTFSYTSKSAYDKMYARMLKYNRWTPAQATSSLRFTAPRVYETYTKGLLTYNVKTGKAKGTFTQTVHRPILEVDKSLGIKTRGGADYKEITKITRTLSKDPASKKIFSQETGYRYGGFTDKAGKIKKVDDFNLIGKETRAIAFDQKGYKLKEDLLGTKYWDPAKIKNIFSVTKDKAFFKLGKTDIYGFGVSRNQLGNFKINVNTFAGKPKGQQTLLYKDIKNFDKANTFGSRITGGKKTPFSKTFGGGSKDVIDDLVVQLKKTGAGGGSSASNIVKKIVKQIDKSDDFLASGGRTSQYAGTGQYEQSQSFGGLTQQQILQNQNLLKLSPQLKEFNFVGTKARGVVGVSFAPSLVADKLLVANLLAGRTGLKSDLNFKTNVETMNLLRTGVISKTAVKTSTITKTSPALKSQLKSLLDVGISPINLKNPAFMPPNIPTFKTPSFKIPFKIPFPQTKKSKKGFKGDTDYDFEKAYLPDFTSRSLGLSAESVNVKNLMKKINKIQTGLEIRRGVKVKW